MDKTPPPTQEIISCKALVPAELAGLRCDQVAAQLFSRFSRSRLQQWIKSGALLVDGRPAKIREKLLAGAELAINAVAEADSEWFAEPGDLNIIYEDSEVLVINKPANLVVHPAAGINSGTLVNYILGYLPGNRSLPRGGIVHRLDKDTTGLMVVAKSLQAHASLVRQLESRSVSRHYQAVVCGQMISGGTVDKNIGRHPTARTKMAVVPDGHHAGKPAITHYRIKQKFNQHTELLVSLETGRTHQIRVHMAHIKYPLVGDKTYNPRYRRASNTSEQAHEYLKDFPRQALHACELQFEHPDSGATLAFEAAPPGDYQQLIQVLRDEATGEAQ